MNPTTANSLLRFMKLVEVYTRILSAIEASRMRSRNYSSIEKITRPQKQTWNVHLPPSKACPNHGFISN